MRLRPTCSARRALLRPAAVALALVLATACSPSEPAVPPAPTASAASGAAATVTPVAELQTGLTALLVERVYLVAAATDAVAAAGGRRDAAPAQAALTALDAGSVALADVLGATYTEARQPLLEALRREDDLLARHAVLLVEGDAARTTAVRRALVRAQADLARTVRRVVPTLDAPQVAERLAADVQAQLPPRSYERLRETAAGAAGTARLLADGIANDRALSSPGTDAVRLRAQVTGLLTEHVLLVGALARELREPGATSPSARTALQGNADQLAAVLGESYPAVQAPFLRSWTAHLDRLQRYAAARATSGTADRGLVQGYPAELGRLLADHVRGLPAQSVRTELTASLTSLLAAVDAAAADRPDAPAVLRQAAADVLPATALLSAAVAEDLRLA